MVVDTTKESVCVNQIVGQKNADIAVEGDVIVPDIKPDILNTISTSGNVCIYKKEVLDGKVRIDGSVQVYIIYLADNDDGAVRGISTPLNFTEIINVENCRTGMTLNENVNIKSIEARVLNGRKVSVKANLNVDMRVFSNDDIDVIKEVKGVDDLQKLSNHVEVNSLVGQGTTKVYAKDNMAIDNIDNLVEILKADIRLMNRDVKISYNKVLVKADAQVRIMYLTEDNRINSVESQIPVMGFIDIANVSDNNMCDTSYELKNLVVKPNSDEQHSIYVEAEVEISCSAFEKKNLDVTEDLYSPTETINFTKKQVDTMCGKNVIKDICPIKEKISAPEVMGSRVYDTQVNTNLENTKVLNDRIVYEGELKVNILYASDNLGMMDTKTVNIPFNFSMDAQDVNPNTNVETSIEPIKQNFVVLPDGYIDVSVDLQFNANVSNFRTINIINEITCDQTRTGDSYSMVIYFVKPNDTLWKIAKSFNSTMDDIIRLNNMEKPEVLPARNADIYS
jgi:LysM repeat protein